MNTKWIHKEGAYKDDIFCSRCDALALSPSYNECTLEDSNYCPNCGAKMDKEEKE